MGDRNLRRFAKALRLADFAIALVFLFAVNADVRAQANFYAGKTITVVVGSAPGGGSG
jgi:tripartite-type tricarboxylate transporter receptor subunit TctC